MRQVTIVGAPTPTTPFERWVMDTLTDMANASATNVLQDVADSGASLVTLSGAAADQMAYFTGETSTDLTALTAFARTLIAAANAAAARSVLDVQQADATLASIAGLGTAADKGLYTTAADTWAEFALTSVGRTLLGQATQALMRTTGLGLTTVGDAVAIAANAAAARTAIGAVIGTNVQAYDSQLFSNIPLGNSGNAITANYTCSAADAQKLILTQTNALTVYIPTEASVNYPVGTVLSFANFNGTNTMTIAPNDGANSLYWANGTASGTGNRTLTSVGFASAIKLLSSAGVGYWTISGGGLS